jgi:hypothetical protein
MLIIMYTQDTKKDSHPSRRAIRMSKTKNFCDPCAFGETEKLFNAIPHKLLFYSIIAMVPVSAREYGFRAFTAKPAEKPNWTRIFADAFGARIKPKDFCFFRVFRARPRPMGFTTLIP